jgi:phage shock protein C
MEGNMARKKKNRRKGSKRQDIKRLYRSRTERIIAGVCGGIGEYFEVDPTLIRLLWVIFVLLGGSGIIGYIIAWIIIPEEP